MNYFISKDLVVKLRHSANRAELDEICYLVLGNGLKIRHLLSIPNELEDPYLRHQIDFTEAARLKACSRFRKLDSLGYLHTHPLSKSYPSPADLLGYPGGTVIFIYSDFYHQLRAYRISDDNSSSTEIPVKIEPR